MDYELRTLHLFLDHGRVHVGNLSDGELGSDLSRDDSLCTGIRESPRDAVDGDGGIAPHVGQQVNLQETANSNNTISHNVHRDEQLADLFHEHLFTLLVYMS